MKKSDAGTRIQIATVKVLSHLSGRDILLRITGRKYRKIPNARMPIKIRIKASFIAKSRSFERLILFPNNNRKDHSESIRSNSDYGRSKFAVREESD